MHRRPAPPLPRIAIVGLGYVGLPLAVAFGARRPVTGFDSDPVRIAELRAGQDRTREVTDAALSEARHLDYTDDPQALRDCRIYIVTVPTPIDDYKRPELGPLLRASATVGALLKPGDLVIYESTVYPGCTEEDCVPVLERHSGLRYLRADTAEPGFYCGYSPERINPGDPEHRLATIRKITSGSTPAIARYVDDLYRDIVPAGTHRASSIRVAEAAKVIENTQRDLNIALMNELALICDRLGLDTLEVLEAAGSKWNFLPFRPGLVGGHCIGVDPYYLTHKAVSLGYHPEVILAGRRINDRMGIHVAATLVKRMLGRGIPVLGSRVLVLGLAFKENCPDLRNTRVIDIIRTLREYAIAVDCHDPWIDRDEARARYGLDCLAALPPAAAYDAIVLAVAHREFVALGAEGLRRLGTPRALLYDVKSVLPAGAADGRL